MESNFYSDDFEQLIREKTEQYKMYPSEKAWKGVYSSLHTKKRWFYAGMSVLVTGIIVIAGKELIAPAAHPVLAKHSPQNTSTENKTIAPENPALPAAFAEYRPGAHTADRYNGQEGGPNGEPVADLAGIRIVDPMTGQPAGENASSGTQTVAGPPIDAVKAAAATASGQLLASLRPQELASGVNTRSAEAYAKYMTRLRMGLNDRLGESSVDMALTPDLFPGSLVAGLQIPLHQNSFIRFSSRARMAEELENTVAADAVAVIVDTVKKNQRINWLQDYAVYNLTPAPHRSGDFLEFYVTPAASFRTLSGGAYQNPKINGNTGANPPPAPAPSLGRPMSISDYADHTPAMGFSTGMNLVHKVARNLALKAGLQFTYTRFSLRSFSTDPNPVRTPLPQDSTASASASVSSFGAQQVQYLHNEYYELSAPIGLQVRILNNDRLQLNVAATVQPTYMLYTNSYLLTTDYSHYTTDPSSFRRWNLAAGVEANIAYRLNKNISLLAGPEFRYQVFSTYNSQYPIKENLQQYGLKLGFIKALP